ncbi:facilitated trehalose transporter Tret1-like [Arctopsyche grandis]|uniref:facilitated trehalose transporter Tret1-like n=1 Tax=Arctopsyche grandis TaxID=121162 RepID=UPI00406D7C1A
MSEKSDIANIAYKTSTFNQYVAVITCSFMATMYGHAIGWSSAAVPQLEDGGPSLPSGVDGIDSTFSGWVGGAFCLGALVSAPVHGLLADAKGRKFAGYIVSLCFMIHWVFISLGSTMTFVFIGRAFGGAGAAGSITVASIYSNEVAESRIRGTLGGFLALLYVMGIFSAFIVGAYASFYTTVNAYLLISVLYLPVWWKMPESPVYLVLNGQDEKALSALAWLRKCDKSNAITAFEELKVQQAGAAKAATVREFFKHPASVRGLILGSGISSIQTFSGIFAVHNYASTIFKRAGGILDPFTSTIVYGGLMCVGAMMPPLFVDRTGRKSLLAWSCSLLALSMSVLGFYFWAMSAGYLKSDPNADPEAAASAMDMVIALVPVVTLSWSVLVYYIGLGSVTYITVAELYLDEMRGVGGAIVAAVIWLTSFVLLQFFGPTVELLGDHYVFFFFSAVCCFGTIFTIVWLPETKGRSPQEIAVELEMMIK